MKSRGVDLEAEGASLELASAATAIADIHSAHFRDLLEEAKIQFQLHEDTKQVPELNKNGLMMISENIYQRLISKANAGEIQKRYTLDNQKVRKEVVEVMLQNLIGFKNASDLQEQLVYIKEEN